MTHDSSELYVVTLSPLAIEDLIALRGWIVDGADAPKGDRYLDFIEARIAALSQFPRRGTSRDDLAPGLRTLAFKRRLVIAYHVADHMVTVLRVIAGARELAPMFV